MNDSVKKNKAVSPNPSNKLKINLGITSVLMYLAVKLILSGVFIYKTVDSMQELKNPFNILTM